MTGPLLRPLGQLPADLADFTGHADAVDRLVGVVSNRRDDGPPPVAVVVGPPGVGKSSLALRVAHAVSAGFPDGQLYLELAGTSGEPRDPAVMLAEVLHALGITGTGIPDGLHARAGLYRSLLRGRRILLVLDDAANAEQIRPLLPAGGGCAVLVTSRRLHTDLPCAHHIELDVLQPAEAHHLLAGIIGAARVAREPADAAAILASCGHLPLAIRIAGGKLAGRPRWSLRVLRERLTDESRRLGELCVGELQVRASFALSLRQLPERAKLAFGLLGLLGPQTFPGWVVGPLLGHHDGDDVLDILLDANLVQLVATDAIGQPRHRLHDLLRTYAVETVQTIPSADRQQAITRYLAAWLWLTERAAGRIGFNLFRATPGTAPRWPLSSDDDPAVEPLPWFDTERATLLDTIKLAAGAGRDELAWELANASVPYYDHRSLYEDWQRSHQLALAVARRQGNTRGEAELRRALGQVHIYRDNFTGAMTNLRRSLELFEQVGDKRGLALATAGIGTIYRVTGRHDQALLRATQALDLITAVGDRNIEAQLHKSIGTILLTQGHTDRARTYFEQAIALTRQLGDTHREAIVLREFSQLHLRAGKLQTALDCLEHALRIFDDLHDDRCVAFTLLRIGQAHATQGATTTVEPMLERAARIFAQHGDRTNETACRRLLDTVSTGPSGPGDAASRDVLVLGEDLAEDA